MPLNLPQERLERWIREQGDEDIRELLRRPLPPAEPGLTAQVIGTGSTVRNSAMPEVFETLMYAARRELCITTPYYVPDEAMQTALCASAYRGVATTLIVPARKGTSGVVSIHLAVIRRRPPTILSLNSNV